MPYEVADGAILELTFEGRHNDQTVMNVTHWYLSAPGGIDDGGAFALAFCAWVKGVSTIWDTYLDCISDNVIDIQAYAQWIVPTRYRYVVAAGAPATGGRVANAAPQNVQGSITLFGDQANRHGLGRKAMPGVPLEDIANGKIVANLLTDYQSFADALLQDYVGAGGAELGCVIFNRADPGESQYVQGGFPQEEVRVERRRTLRVGT